MPEKNFGIRRNLSVLAVMILSLSALLPSPVSK